MIRRFREEGGCSMPRTSVVQQSSASLTHVPWYPENLLPQLQATLAAVADLEARYDIELEQLAGRSESEAVRTQVVADLEARFQAERDPFVQRLAELHHRMMAAMAHQDICESVGND